MNNSNEVSKRTFVPKTIGESLQKVNQKFSSKFGRIDYVIHVKWKQIVGSFFANHSQPMKISSVKDFIDDENEMRWRVRSEFDVFRAKSQLII